MLQPPFELLSCSWPRPVEHAGGRWTSAPEWGAPPMPFAPPLRWESVRGELCWGVDWREWMRSGLRVGDPALSGEMRGFHLVFRVRVARAGALAFWADDGCVIRRAGAVVHHDPEAHALTRHTLAVAAGDVLEVAQWQHTGDWRWSACMDDRRVGASALDVLAPYRAAVEERLRSPNGPPLKFYTHGGSAARAVVGIYSLVLRGYAPAGVLLFGSEQWSPAARRLFAALLPFAEVVSPHALLHRVASEGSPALADLARRHWFVMKAAVALLHPPVEFCLMDDDVFVLDRVDDALSAFRRHDLVYTPDTDHGDAYRRAWGWMHDGLDRMTTGRFNAGLYWMRNLDPPRRVAELAARVAPDPRVPWLWEQGFIAALFARRRALALPAPRYFYPLFDGLPGGAYGYDYGANPCGFASVHFGGLAEKPDDAAALQLAADVLGPTRSG